MQKIILSLSLGIQSGEMALEAFVVASELSRHKN